MNLADLVTPDRVVVPLEDNSLQGAADALVEQLIATGHISEVERLRERVAEERGEDVVALADRAFLLHYRTDAVSDLTIALGVAPEPIVREIGDSEPQRARIVLMMLAPPRMAARYLQVLGAFVRLLSRPEAAEEIASLPTPAAVAAYPPLAEVELPPQLVVRELMTERPRTTAPDADLRDAARDLVRAGVSMLPVVDRDGRLVGLLGDRELLTHLIAALLPKGAHPRPADAPAARKLVRDIMTRQVLAVSPDQPLAEVASTLINKDVEGVPVVREGRLVGFLTRGDIVRKLIGS